MENFDKETRYELARQIADIVNRGQQLQSQLHPLKVIETIDEYITLVDDDKSQVIACVRVRKINWYIGEISHLAVHPDYRNLGYGRRILELAEERAYSKGAHVLQCTIRLDNDGSTSLFFGYGWQELKQFKNPKTGNKLRIMYK